MIGKLFIVATPIGNLSDITLRALETFKRVDVIVCEDTRHTKILLDRYEIKKPLISFHQHSKLQRVDQIVGELKSGKSVALVTDAGTPGVSDPGGVLVAEAIKQGIKVEPIPGASALTALISVAGIPMDKFIFLGFLPHKKGRETLIKKMVVSDLPVIFYESPHRIVKTLESLVRFSSPPLVGGARGGGYVILGRELTKQFEEILRGSVEEVLDQLKKSTIKGEFVVIYHK